jgi:putative Mg2+ transporter-C (MgtC) family protein
MQLLEYFLPTELAGVLFKVFLSGLLGGIVGLERESHGQAAGLRTFILVAMGSCLMMMVSLHLADLFKHLGAESAVRLDPGRIASYALAGMGFLGAGAIITGKGSVRGLTTAAGMWLTTGVGLATGAGFFLPAILVTLLSYLVLYTLRHTKALVRKDRYVHLEVTTEGLEDRLLELEAMLQDAVSAKVQWRRYKVTREPERIVYSFQLLGKEDEDWYLVVKRFMRLKGVSGVRLKESKVM